MHFRAAVIDDAELIATLHAESWQRTYRGMMPDGFLDGPVAAERLDAWRNRLRNLSNDLWVDLAFESYRPAGIEPRLSAR